jgi:hypothetical protein
MLTLIKAASRLPWSFLVPTSSANPFTCTFIMRYSRRFWATWQKQLQLYRRKTSCTAKRCAINDCHTDKSAEWAAAAIERWFGPDREGFQTYAEAFHADWRNQTDAEPLLSSVVKDDNTPAFVRASALTELAQYLYPLRMSNLPGRVLLIRTRWCESERSTCWKACRRRNSGR